MKQNKFIIILIAFFLTFFLGYSEKLIAEVTADNVSMIQLISNPEKFDGKYIRVIGFARIEFEGDAIYLHEEDYKHGITRNGIWLDLTNDCCGKNIKRVDRKYVLVEGTFSSKNQGHMDLFSGAVENIKRLEVWNVKRSYADKEINKHTH